MNVGSECVFENIIAKIFEAAGYSVNQNVKLQRQSGDIDIVAEKDNKCYCVEVKYLQLHERAVERIYLIGKTVKMKPVAVVGSKIDERKRSYYAEKYPDLILIDIANLLFVVQYHTKLRNELISGLPYSIEEIEPQEDVDETCEEMYELDDSDLYEIKKMGRTLSRITGLER